MRKIECLDIDSSVIKDMIIHTSGIGEYSSLNVTFQTGDEYYYPKVHNNTLYSILFADSIGSAFNQLISGKAEIRYARLS